MTRDQEARDAARLGLGSNAVVSAGAGTGKTTILTDRILFSLLCGKTSASRLVALTFTEKAASEIKVRVASKLEDLVALILGRPLPAPRAEAGRRWLDEARLHFGRTPEQVRVEAEAAIHDLDRAAIGTIHHFAAQLLRLYPVEAGIDPSFEVDQGDLFDELFEAEWALWLDEELGESPRRPALWLELLELVGLPDLEALARELSREGLRQGGLGATPGMRDSLKRSIDEHEALLGLPDPGRGKAPDTIRRVSAHLKSVLGSLERGAAASLPRSVARPDFGSAKWPKAWENMPGAELYEETKRFAESVTPASEAMVRKAAALVLPFADEFRVKYVRRGLIDYDGLLVAARALVRDDLRVRAELKARYDVFLIDEFQDTDPLQGELLLFLGESPESRAKHWTEIKFAPGKMFIVGDPKQSIYRFRGADIRAYERFTGMLIEQGAKKCDLQTNFRSHEGLIAPINAIFEKIMLPEEGLQPSYLPIFPRPGLPPSEAGLEIALICELKDAQAEISAPARQRAEARWIAGFIQRGRAEGRHALKDIAILLRSVTPLGYYLDALKEFSIPYVVEADRYFYGTQEVVDFVNLLRALDDPFDELSLAGLLRSPMCGLDDRQLYELARARQLSYVQDPKDGLLSAAAHRRVAAFFKSLRGLRARVGREPLTALIGRVLEETFLLEHCSAAYFSEQMASNLMKFVRMAAQAGYSRAMTLKEFIREVCRSMERSADEGESPLADEQLDAVRILTIHKSKGLEFPVVIMPNLSAGSRGGADKPAAVVDWGEQTAGLRLLKAKAPDAAMAFIEGAEKRREERERVRLLYVGLTRAKERLVLMGAPGGSKGSLSSLLHDAGAWPEAGLRPEAVSLGGFKVPLSYVDAAYQSEAKGQETLSSPEALDQPALAGVWEKRRASYLKALERRIFTSPTEGPKNFEPREEEGSPVPASLVGQLCHRFLERWDFSRGGDYAGALAAATEALTREYPDESWGGIEEEARIILKEFLSSPAARELGGCEILGREVPFICPWNGQVLRGSIDLLYRASGRLWIADYKTDRIKPGVAAKRALRHRDQGRAYVEAARRALGETAGFKVIFLRSGEMVEVA